MAEIILFNISTKQQHVCSTFAWHTNQLHKSQPCKRAANVILFNKPSCNNLFQLYQIFQQQNFCATHKTPSPPTNTTMAGKKKNTPQKNNPPGQKPGNNPGNKALLTPKEWLAQKCLDPLDVMDLLK